MSSNAKAQRNDNPFSRELLFCPFFHTQTNALTFGFNKPLLNLPGKLLKRVIYEGTRVYKLKKDIRLGSSRIQFP